MSRRALSRANGEGRGLPPAAGPAPLPVTDHAVLRYLERVLDIPLDDIRAEIGRACARHQGAPCVRAGGARFMIHKGVVVTTLADRTVPMFVMLAGFARSNAERTE